MSSTKQAIRVDVSDTADAAALFQEFAHSEARLEEAKAIHEPLKKRLIDLVNSKQVGSYEAEAGGWVARVTRPTKVTWDTDSLAAYFGADLPVYVKRTLGIGEQEWRRLSVGEREAIVRYRTEGAGSPKIEVERV